MVFRRDSQPTIRRSFSTQCQIVFAEMLFLLGIILRIVSWHAPQIAHYPAVRYIGDFLVIAGISWSLFVKIVDMTNIFYAQVAPDTRPDTPQPMSNVSAADISIDIAFVDKDKPV